MDQSFSKTEEIILRNSKWFVPANSPTDRHNDLKTREAGGVCRFDLDVTWDGITQRCVSGSLLGAASLQSAHWCFSCSVGELKPGS